MLISIQEAENIIKSGKKVFFAGEEKLIKNLPKGEWIAGTIPYFIDEKGGVFSEDKIFANIIPDYITNNEIKWYANIILCLVFLGSNIKISILKIHFKQVK